MKILSAETSFTRDEDDIHVRLETDTKIPFQAQGSADLCFSMQFDHKSPEYKQQRELAEALVELINVRSQAPRPTTLENQMAELLKMWRLVDLEPSYPLDPPYHGFRDGVNKVLADYDGKAELYRRQEKP